MSGSKQFTPEFKGMLTLELTVAIAPGEHAEGVDHSQPTLALTVEHAEGRSPIEMQVASEDHHAFQVLIRAEVAMDATDGLKRRPGEGMGRSDDAITVWGDDTNRPAFAPGQPHSPQGTADRPTPLEATIPSRGGESAPAEQHSRPRIRRRPVTRGLEAVRPLSRTCLRSVLRLAQRVPAGVLVVPLALLLFLLTISNDSITALTVVPLWVLLPPLVLLLLLLVLAQRGRLTMRTAVPVWTLLVPVTLLLLLLGLAKASTPTAGGHHRDHSAAAARSNVGLATVTDRTPLRIVTRDLSGQHSTPLRGYRHLPKPRHAVAFTLDHARATTPSRNHPLCDPGQPC